jgi:prepilin-type N-terminal cleavage/methylation domain-containing protein
MKQLCPCFFHRFRSHGFTLIELLITILIMGILSMIGISMYQTTQRKSRDVQRKTGLTTLTKALEVYMNDKGVYPPSSVDGKILWCGSEDDPTAFACDWGVPWIDVSASGDEKTVYLQTLPKDKAYNQQYFYEAVETGGLIKGYRLYARLENTNDPDYVVYTPNCSTDASVIRPCTYALTSESVTAVSAASAALTLTPTVAVSTSTPSPTSIPTAIPTATATPTPTRPPVSCIALGSQCRPSVGDTCCSGTCVTTFVDALGPYGTCEAGSVD